LETAECSREMQASPPSAWPRCLEDQPWAYDQWRERRSKGEFPLGAYLLSLNQLLGEYPCGEDKAQTQLRCPHHMLEDGTAADLWPVIDTLGR
jgi:hypothetical protein